MFWVHCTATCKFAPPKNSFYFTQEWKGERFADDRPKVPDEIVKRLANVSIEEAWESCAAMATIVSLKVIFKLYPEKPLVGRVLTAQYMPARPDMDKPIREKGKADGYKGSPNSWPIDALQINDVYVADGYGKVIDGTLIGDNLGNSIYAKSKRV
ncbi:MAG: hypothetical protein R2822_01850 [Spirosomataceae bacterium]